MGSTERILELVEHERILPVEEPVKLSLGERNPLIYPPDLARQPEIVDALKRVSSDLIEGHDGLHPVEFSVFSIPVMGGSVDRFVARFETESLSEAQVRQLEGLVRDMYRQDVRTRRRLGGSKLDPTYYPEIEMPDKRTKTSRHDKSKLGWYFGPTMMGDIDCTDVGLLVHRDVGSRRMAQYLKGGPADWFTNPNLSTPESRRSLPPRYIVELREGSLSQAEIAVFIAQVGTILNTGEKIEDPRLIYEAYRGIYMLGVDHVGRENIRGLDAQLDEIQRRLFIPLESGDASHDVTLQARSILMAGVPGTGKTLAAELFLDMNNGVFFLPVTAGDLAYELTAPLEKRWLIERIERIYAETGMPVVIHVDDMEKLAEDPQTRTPLMQLMSGRGRRNILFLGSTNKPESFPTQLLQPDRFVPVYFGLPQEEARYSILCAHAHYLSRSGVPIFQSETEREFILQRLAEETHAFTPRLLEDICNTAKGYWFERVREILGRQIDVSADLVGNPMTDADWGRAYEDVKSRYNLEIIEKDDRQIRDAVAQARTPLGFSPQSGATSLFRRSDSAVSGTSGTVVN